MVGKLVGFPVEREIYTCRSRHPDVGLGHSGLNPAATGGISVHNEDDLGRVAPPVNETVRRAQAGDSNAFRALYDEHAGRVFAICLRLAGDRAEAEELTQDVFGARRSAGRRERRVSIVEQPELLERTPRSPPAGGSDLEAAIARLPEGARTVFVLHDVEGYQHEEIGAMTGIAEGTSKAQLHRARRLLRENLER